MAEPILLSDLPRYACRALANRVRLLRRGPDYVVLQVSGRFPEWAAPARRPFPLSLLPWPAPPMSVEAFADTLDRLAGDPRLRGAVLVISGLSAGPAALEALRLAVGRFRAAGKRAIAYVRELDMWSYYLACACDQIVAPESASFLAAGLWAETLFLKDTLALVGIEADLEAIAEYKVAPDTFRRSAMTEPHREMLESLLDSVYGVVVAAIAAGRKIEADRVRELLDGVPYTAAQALDAGLLDGICYEDELPGYLGSADRPARLLPWDQAARQLGQPWRWRSRRAVGIISVQGTIVPGPSRQPPIPVPIPLPIPPEQAGCDTVVAQLRAAARDRRLAALVLHINSPGGSALASDLIWREVSHLSRLKPVVVAMGERAASGGYYIAAAAQRIVAHATTLTGSIGIWGGKVVTRGLYERLQARREVVWRGRAAGLYSDTAPFGDEERRRVRAELGAGYARFKDRVARGRQMDLDRVEALARGRVWSGEQALAHGLVDRLGDLRAAADLARELAGLDPRRHAPLVPVPVPRRMHLPAPASGGGAWLDGLASLLREGIWAMAPWHIHFRG